MKKLSILLALCLLLSACAPAAAPEQSIPETSLSTVTPESSVPATDGADATTEATPQSADEATRPTEKPTEATKPQKEEKPTKPDCKHVDEGDDGKCDSCGVSVLVIVDFYNINDLHGKLADGDNHPGVDELTTLLKKAKKNDQHALFLSSGDMWQGAPESNLTKGLIITDWMNHMGFSAMALGNHEFDWGEAPIKENDKLAKFPILGINVYDRSTYKRASYCDSSVLVDKGDIQIGIIGAIGD